MNCPLCLSKESELFTRDEFRNYFRCLDCQLIYVPRDQILSEQLEKERYEAHQNHEDDPGYQKYLTTIIDVVSPLVTDGSVGLDFGSGRTKLMSQLFFQRDLIVYSYDLYFFPDDKVFDQKYDFIIMSEVIEHLMDPRETLIKLKSLLKQNGKIFVKTKLAMSDKWRFDQWFYKRDLTHVQFFNMSSLQKLAKIIECEHLEDLKSVDLYLLR